MNLKSLFLAAGFSVALVKLSVAAPLIDSKPIYGYGSKLGCLVFPGQQEVEPSRAYRSQKLPASWLSVSYFQPKTLMQVSVPLRKIVPHGDTNFTSETGGFSVWLPGKPGDITGIDRFATDKSKPKACVFVSYSQPIAYVISVSSASNYYLNGLMVELPIDTSRKREEIQLGEFPGREIEFINEGDIVDRIRTYVTPEICYAIIVRGPKTEIDKQSTQINRVFDSFRILPR